MGKANFTEDFKRDAVVQITERGQPQCAGGGTPQHPPGVMVEIGPHVRRLQRLGERAAGDPLPEETADVSLLIEHRRMACHGAAGAIGAELPER